MPDTRPDVSVIIAAYAATDFIATAARSALAQQAMLEVIVSPDDSADYGFLAALDSRIRVLDSLPAGARPTGPVFAVSGTPR